MSKLAERNLTIANNNLKDLKPFRGNSKLPPKLSPEKVASDNLSPDITPQAKSLNAQTEMSTAKTSTSDEALSKAKTVATSIAKTPVIPLIIPKETTKLADALADKKIKNDKIKDHDDDKLHFLKKPAVIFIEGFSAFGISNGDGIKEMADNFPGAKRFSWEDHDDIIKEIKKHAPQEPVILVGHSFGGDTAIEVANEFNSAKNGFRPIDLLVSIDAVGMNKTIIPINVKRNLNYFGEGVLPFVHGDPTIARNTKYTEVTNELRDEWHSKMDDNPEVQFEIFQKINDVIYGNHPGSDGEILIEITKENQIREIIDALKSSQKNPVS